MTLREQIEEAAREIAREGHCRYCDRLTDPHPFYDNKCRADVEDTAQEILAQVEKATAQAEYDTNIWFKERCQLIEALDEAIKDREYFHAELQKAEKAVAEIAQKIVNRTSCDFTGMDGSYDFDVGLDQLEHNSAAKADRQAREEGARIAGAMEMCHPHNLHIAQAIRATIKEAKP